MTAPGETVVRGQDLVRVLDCSGVVVTATVGETAYNQLRIGDAARFRFRGASTDYQGRIVGLTGVATAPANLAIQPSALAKEPYRVTVALPELARAERVQRRPHRPRDLRQVRPYAVPVLLETLAPGILVIGAAWVVLPWLRADDERARAAMVAVMVALDVALHAVALAGDAAARRPHSRLRCRPDLRRWSRR